MSRAYTLVMNENLVEEGDVFFIQRGDGYVFACGELEAWNTLRNRGNWQRKDFQIIGTSNGATFKRIIAESEKEKKAILAEMTAFKDKLERYEEAENKMLYEDLLDETDPKVKRVRALKEKVKTELEPLQARLQEFSARLVSKAFEAELEVAKLSPRAPKNQDVAIGDQSSSRKDEILTIMKKR